MPRLAVLVLLASLHAALATLDPAVYAKDLEDNQASAIVSDQILGKLTPFFTGYGSINTAVPVEILVNCHYGPQPFPGPADASNSESGKKYVNDIAYIVGDGYQTVTQIEPREDYNQSWALGLVFQGLCKINEAHHPACNFTFDDHSRASGLTQITRVPDANITFVSCGVYMDETIVNSTTCFQDDSITVVPVTTAYAEESVSRIEFFSTYQDLSADGPPGYYTLTYACQFGWNTEIIFNPPGNIVGLDPRLTSFLPNAHNGLFGPVGNGGNTGRRLLKGHHF